MNSIDQDLRRWCGNLESGRRANSAFGKRVADSGLDSASGDSTKPTSPRTAGFSIQLCSGTAAAIVTAARSFTTLVCSRLGHDPRMHAEVGKQLMRGVWQAHHRRSVLLVASDSAIEPWASRASELTGTPLLTIGVEQAASSNKSDILVRCLLAETVTRDWVAITMADRVDAMYVRRGGQIEKCLVERIERFGTAATRVAITSRPACAGSRLVQRGAIGWFLSGADLYEPRNQSASQSSVPVANTSFSSRGLLLRPKRDPGSEDVALASVRGGTSPEHSWLEERNTWLVHCTRTCLGPWPGETKRQYQDSILLGNGQISQRSPLDTLCRILRSGTLLASAVVSSVKDPVVCWSAVPLLELLGRRCFRSHLKRWDYEPFGIAVRLDVVKRWGCQPVIYGQPRDRKKLPAGDRFRFQAVGKSVDWRSEREWRNADSFSLLDLPVGDIRVFAVDSANARNRLSQIPWQLTLLRSEQLEIHRKAENSDLS